MKFRNIEGGFIGMCAFLRRREYRFFGGGKDIFFFGRKKRRKRRRRICRPLLFMRSQKDTRGGEGNSVGIMRFVPGPRIQVEHGVSLLDF